MPDIKYIGDVKFGPMLAHNAEKERIAAAECIRSGHCHMNYKPTPRVGRQDGTWLEERVQYNVGRFSFFANLRAKTNLDSKGQVKFLVEEIDHILGLHAIGASP